MVPNQAVAEEAVQDTWMGVVRGIDRFEGRSSFKTWLFRILINRTRSAGSREYPNAPLESLSAVDPDRFDAQGQWADPIERWVEETEDRLDAARWLPILKTALDDLPPRKRQVVLLRDVEGSQRRGLQRARDQCGQPANVVAPWTKPLARDPRSPDEEGLTDAVAATQGHRVPAGG